MDLQQLVNEREWRKCRGPENATSVRGGGGGSGNQNASGITGGTYVNCRISSVGAVTSLGGGGSARTTSGIGVSGARAGAGGGGAARFANGVGTSSGGAGQDGRVIFIISPSLSPSVQFP